MNCPHPSPQAATADELWGWLSASRFDVRAVAFSQRPLTVVTAWPLDTGRSRADEDRENSTNSHRRLESGLRGGYEQMKTIKEADLPSPRLELRWGKYNGETCVCDYNLVWTLTPYDIRHKKKDEYSGKSVEKRLRLGGTRATCSKDPSAVDGAGVLP